MNARYAAQREIDYAAGYAVGAVRFVQFRYSVDVIADMRPHVIEESFNAYVRGVIARIIGEGC